MRKSVLRMAAWLVMGLVMGAGRVGGVAAQPMMRLVAAPAPSRANRQATSQAVNQSTGAGAHSSESTEPSAVRMQQQTLARANNERHKKMVADADRLVALSAELKAAVDTTSKDELSVEVVRKAAEIERLAHDVGQRMKN